MTYTPIWDLDVFFKGGSGSREFNDYLEQLTAELGVFKEKTERFQLREDSSESELSEVLTAFQYIAKQVGQAGAYVSCLQAQNTKDVQAGLLRGRITNISAEFGVILAQLDQKLAEIDDFSWNKLLNSTFTEIKFVLNERRDRVKEKLSLPEETMIQSLAVDGYHGWGQLYDTIVSKMTVKVEENGETKLLSIGQAFNKFSDPDREVRKSVFQGWEEAWSQNGDLFADTLNHLAGFRLSVYEKRGWNDVLKEPLSLNRMSGETLNVMWETISRNKGPFLKYLKRKAELLGVERLDWYDLDAPVGKANSKMGYQEGAEFILKQFGQFGSQLESFCRKAFEDNWIEAEDRADKAPGGFCTSFPESGQTRIFMTYSGTPNNVATLAHELGHAFHQHAMEDVHTLNQNYAMNVAETASTFAEMIVADASVKKAGTKEEHLALLEDKIQRSAALLMNIHARFLFETSFYEERKKGAVSAERLNELMEGAQKEAYGDSLGTYHKGFWASKLHFYITGTPFYNFPYTFGYLFALGIYARAGKEGKSFEEKYISLLKDTGSMTVEELAAKHLSADIKAADFWEEAVKMTLKDVEEFLELTK